jgi:hypothetical protein
MHYKWELVGDQGVKVRLTVYEEAESCRRVFHEGGKEPRPLGEKGDGRGGRGELGEERNLYRICFWPFVSLLKVKQLTLFFLVASEPHGTV